MNFDRVVDYIIRLVSTDNGRCSVVLANESGGRQWNTGSLKKGMHHIKFYYGFGQAIYKGKRDELVIEICEHLRGKYVENMEEYISYYKQMKFVTKYIIENIKKIRGVNNVFL